MGNKLKKDSLGLAHSVAMGVAGTAPSFSISASLATLLGAIGILAPAALIYCGIIMFGITFAYMHLNRLEANAGASYAWVGLVFNRTLGFFAGWTLLVSSTLFMVSATIPAGNAALMLVRPDLVGNQTAVTGVSLGILLVVSAVVIRGISITGYLQSVMTALEIVILTVVIATAFWKYGNAAMHTLSWRDLSITSFSPALFASGAVIAIYFFWGWDVALNLNEETKSPGRLPGLAAVLAMVVITILFASFSAVTLYIMDDAGIEKSGTNIIFAVADRLFPRPWGYAAVLALMLSTIGTLETSILQFTRTLFAKSRDGMMHGRWGNVHEEWKTPVQATALIAGLGSLLLLLSLVFKDIGATLKASIDAIGVQAACYYGLAGFACAWHYRNKAGGSAGNFLTMVLWPALSAVALWISAAMAFTRFDTVVKVVAVGGILLGTVPLMTGLRRRSHSGAARAETVEEKCS